MSSLNEIYKQQLMRGGPAYGDSDVDEVLGDKIAEETLKSGDFFTIGSDDGLIKKITGASNPVLGMVCARIQPIVDKDVSTISETSSSDLQYINSVYTAKDMVPYIKIGYKIRLIVVVDVNAGDAVYIDVATGHLTKTATNNIRLGKSVFEESAEAGNFVNVSFNVM